MELIQRTFRCNSANERINIISSTQDGKVFFKCRDVARALGYNNESTANAIKRHIPTENRYKFRDIQGWAVSTHPSIQPHAVFTDVAGVFALAYRSNVINSSAIVNWISSTILPSLRIVDTTIAQNTRGHLRISSYQMNTEYDLHTKVVSYIREYHRDALITPGLGESQDTDSRRIQTYRKGYTSGQCDLSIDNYHKEYRGLCLEFKSPSTGGKLSERQISWLRDRERNGYKCVVSNDDDKIVKEIDSYMAAVRVKCEFCSGRGFFFKSERTLASHKCGFHKRQQLSLA